MVKYILISLLLVFTTLCHGSSAEWITHYTKGQVKISEAKEIERAIYLLSVKHEIDPEMIFRIIAVESRFKIKAKSSHGAKGLMQIIPKYHKDKINKRNIYNIYVNIDVGIQIFKEYKEKYKTTAKALKAYNGETKTNIYTKKIYAVNIYDATDIFSSKEKVVKKS